MKFILSLLALASLITGFVLSLAARKFLLPEHRLSFSFSPKNWIPVGKTRPYFRPPGYILVQVGAWLIALGGLLVAITYLVF